MEMKSEFKIEIESEINKRAKDIEIILKKFLPKEEGFQRVIMEAMHYSMLSGGKRLRPMLMQETYWMFGGQAVFLLEPFMAAIEMIHTYSLIHDDLPAMDNDMFRRGRKTTHVVYGEAMGILAGDALLNFAFETVTKACVKDALKPDELKRALRAMQILAEKAGIYGMLGGQVVDVQNEQRPEPLEKEIKEGLSETEMLEFIYRLKTGALLEASMMIGAVLAGAKEDDIRAIEQAAGYAGLAFQIQDDILDVTSTLEELGKPVGSDEKNQKLTYVSLYGTDAAKQQVKQLTENALEALEALPVKNEFLIELFKYLVRRRK